MRSLLIAFPLLVICASWWFSLRRTPFALIWAIVCIVVAVGVSGGGLAAADAPSVTIGGLLGILCVLMTPAVLLALCTELLAHEDNYNKMGVIQQFRHDHPQRPKPSKASSEWKVYTKSDTYGGTIVGIQNGTDRRVIGSADPISAMDEFMDIRAQAETAAATYNALSIEAA